MIEASRPDNVINKKDKSGIIVDIAVPAYGRVHGKETEKVEEYQYFRKEIGRLWLLRKGQLVSMVLEALGSVTKRQVD